MALAAVVLAGCGEDGDDGDDGGAGGLGGDAPGAGPNLAVLAGGAAAARGSGLAEPAGPADRVPLATFDADDVTFDEVAAAITGPDGEVTGWCVLLAASPAERGRGLMEVTDLGGYAGMLFVWDDDTSSSFYMRNTPTPLSIAWFDADGDLVSTADMDPCADVDDCPTYGAAGSYRFALEVPQGSPAADAVTEGSTLAAGGPCAERS